MKPRVGLIMVTHNGVGFLKIGIPSLLKTQYPDFHLCIFDNASTDGTKKYLDSLSDKRISVVYYPKNIGMNGYNVTALTICGNVDYIVTLDQDVIDFPEYWLDSLLDAFEKMPDMGYLACNVVQDSLTNGAIWKDYTFEEVRHGGYTYMFGNKYYLVGGWCTMLDAKQYREVGGFRYEPDEAFFQIDGPYCDSLNKHGYKWAILKDVKVYHACGPYYVKKYGKWDEKIRGISYEDAIKQYKKRDSRLKFEEVKNVK